MTITLIILVVLGTLYLSSSFSNANAAPKDPKWGSKYGECTTEYDYETDRYLQTCCWREPVPGQILGQEYCQTCTLSGTNCGDKEKKMDPIKIPESTRPPTNNGPGLENPESEQQPSIKSDEVVVLEDTTKKEFKQNPSTNEETKLLSEDFETDNEGVSSSDDTDSEQQTSFFAKKGSGQNSPVPPECPNQGPIPPDCTMKPKF
ncbi:MAG TPA: hypothetical protein VFT71_06470 [Candidatus Nitrosocosmicus sp.]|nr:hypothetical protein [Candidatus Nitrosocosmicus sp.]